MSIDVRFNIQRGDFNLVVDTVIPNRGVTAIFGPSGSGKTTLLRAISGLEQCEDGYLKVGETVWQDNSWFVPTYKRKIGYVFQEPSLFTHLNVQNNINYGMTRAKCRNSVSKLPHTIELLQISHLLQRMPWQLSGGEQQRVAIARALAADPTMLLLDEPLAALGDEQKAAILPFLESVYKTLAIPVLYVSHSREEVACLADHLLLLDHGRLHAAGTVKDIFTDSKFNIKAKYIVNATGPWVDALRQKNNSTTGKKLRLTKGVHLVVEYDKLPIKQSVYFDVPDGRMMFAIPRGKVTYFGTTDTDYQADINNIKTSLVDATYLISAVNNMFPNITISLNDITSSWAGLRPLIHEDGASASELSRKDEIFVSDSELISIAGGKLTGYRKMAERIVDLVTKKYNRRFFKNFKEIQTEEIILSGGAFANFGEVKSYTDIIYKRIAEKQFDKKDAEYLVYNYGKQTDIILKKFDELTGENSREKIIKAEVWFTIQYEMACSPVDFFMRRTGRIYFNIDSVNLYKTLILNEFSNYFSWNKETLEKNKKELLKELQQATSFK